MGGIGVEKRTIRRDVGDDRVTAVMRAVVTVCLAVEGE